MMQASTRTDCVTNISAGWIYLINKAIAALRILFVTSFELTTSVALKQAPAPLATVKQAISPPAAEVEKSEDVRYLIAIVRIVSPWDVTAAGHIRLTIGTLALTSFE